jgi:hypothetical protein
MLPVVTRCEYMPEPIKDYIVTPHAAIEMRHRVIDEALVARVCANPEQRLRVRTGRDVLQSSIEFAGRVYLFRVFVDVDRSPAEIVTAYRTSKIEKYWRSEP